VSFCHAEYDVTLVKSGIALEAGRSKIESIEWDRQVDQISRASVSYIVANQDCCGQLGLVDHMNTDLVITAGDDGVVWRGPVMRATYGRGRVIVEAADVLAWLERRFVRDDIQTTSEDVSDTFVRIWNSAVASIDPPKHEIIVRPSGVIESRRIKASNYTIAMKAVREMLDTGLDITTVGSRILVGMIAQNPISLSSKDVLGDVRVVKDGDMFANRVITDASGGSIGIYPPGPASSQGGYPLVELSNYDPGITDVASANNASKSRYDFSAAGIRRIHADGGLILRPNPNLNPRNLIAGMPINFKAEDTCYTLEETFRLGRISFSISAGREIVTIDLQPLGSVTGLA